MWGSVMVYLGYKSMKISSLVSMCRVLGSGSAHACVHVCVCARAGHLPWTFEKSTKSHFYPPRDSDFKLKLSV